MVLYGFAKSLGEQKEFKRAKPLAERALAIKEKALEAGHPDLEVEQTFDLLSRIHAGLGNKEQAAEFQDRKTRMEEANAAAKAP